MWAGTVAAILLSFLVTTYTVHFLVIVFGCGLALAMNSAASFRYLGWLTARFASVSALVALVVVQLNAAAIQAAFDSQVPLIILYGLLATLALPGLCAPTAFSRALSIAPLRWLGDRSYSIYLLQVTGGTIVAAVFPALNGLRYFLVAVFVILVLADAMYRWVARPGIRLGKRLADHHLRARAVPPLTQPTG